jgi:hypothetical protein
MDRTVNLTKANQPRFNTPILMESRCGRFSRESYRQAVSAQGGAKTRPGSHGKTQAFKGVRMKPWHPPSGLRRGLAFTVDDTWTPEQALAVMELLDDLRHRVWTHYGLAIQDLLREQHIASESMDEFDADLPF